MLEQLRLWTQRHLSLPHQTRSSGGFTLVEVMIMVGVLSFVSLGVGTMMTNIMSATQTQKYSYGVNDLSRLIRADLSDVTACTKTFYNQPMSAAMNIPITNLQNKTGTNIYSTGTAAGPALYEDNSVYIKSIQLQSYQSVTATTGYASLAFQMGARSANVWGSNLLAYTIQLQVTVNGSNQLVSCAALAPCAITDPTSLAKECTTTTDMSWQSVPLTNLNIAHLKTVTSKVGIGSATPAYLLDVNGAGAGSEIDVRSTGRLTLGDSNKTGGIFLDSAQDLFIGQLNGTNSLGVWTANGGAPIWPLTLTQNGNLGIMQTSPGTIVAMSGGLDVNGTGNTQVVVEKSGAPAFALNASAFNWGDFTLWDHGGGNWNNSITSYKGTVGIGTWNPDTSSSFEIYNASEGFITMGKGHDMHWDGGTDKWFTFVSDGGSTGLTTFSDSNGPHTFLAMQNSNGYVGIGTTSPSYPLQINGKGLAAFGGRPQIMANGDDHTGGGIGVSNDGGFYDYNDGWITFNGSKGLKLAGNSGAASTGTNMFLKGRMGIGTTSPGARLEVVGNAHVTGNLNMVDLTVKGYATFAGNYGTSDRRLKTDIKEIKDGELENVQKLVGVYYHWLKPPPEPNILYKGPEREVGFIAQDVQKIFPETVRKNREGYLALDYSRLIVPVVKAFKELNTKYDEQTTKYEMRVDHLIQENQSLKQRLEQLENL